MLWDVFCRVIDNFGDIGVCWRLACGLAARGQQVRLWVDDPSALAWMAPHLRWQAATPIQPRHATGHPGVTVLHSDDVERALPAPLPEHPQSESPRCGDVVVETFGCDPPESFVQRMQARVQAGHPMHWINLEYLSAEDYEERSHRLRSPVCAGPGAGLHKRFFYPGFTPATGGLLRDPTSFAARERWHASGAERAARLQALGVPVADKDRVVLVFCYPGAPVGALLTQLAQPHEMDRPGQALHVLLAPGAATEQGMHWAAQRGQASVRLHPLPYLAQTDFDDLLWCTDLNFVRGEDSATQALWAPAPHVWQIYPQDDGVHADKLEAFMARWMHDCPPELSRNVRSLWRAWNGLSPQMDALPALPPSDDLWRRAHRRSRQHLLGQNDLVTQLLDFVTVAE